MSRRQTSIWVLITDGDRDRLAAIVRCVPRGSGILILTPIGAAERRRLRAIAAGRRLRITDEKRGVAARVHNPNELRRALLAGTDLILLSPIYPTATHPDWKPIKRMRAAALARLAGRRLIALGGMDERRYASVARLGFRGWAGVSAFRT